MITIITEMTDSKTFENYWVPLVCKYREHEFIFCKTSGLNVPKMKDWSNVRFASKSKIDDVIKHAKYDFLYITNQDEIPTYELMTTLREKPEGLVPKIHGTNNDGLSFSVYKKNYPKFEKMESSITTYKI